MKLKEKTIRIPYNKPTLIGKELSYIRHAHSLRQLAGDGTYTKKTQKWMEDTFSCPLSLLTHSATAALEMMAILAKIEPGDEIIMPSFTFVSTANAFVLRKGIPVFVDIRRDTLNVDEKQIEAAITPKTKAIVPVHYAGVGCEMDEILKIAKKYKLLVLEDAAQGFLAKYKERYLGTLGDMSAFSFHETKNIISGEGGAVLLNKKRYIERAKIIREKGTNRSKFYMGLVDKYTWVDIGSSYLPGEITAAFLMAQLEKAKQINEKRMKLWNRYHSQLQTLEQSEHIRRPIIPSYVTHNAHLYYILTRSNKERIGLMNLFKSRGILAVSHYVPLHSSPAGKKFSRFSGSLSSTELTSNTLLRLPLFYDLSYKQQTSVLEGIYDYYRTL